MTNSDLRKLIDDVLGSGPATPTPWRWSAEKHNVLLEERRR